MGEGLADWQCSATEERASSEGPQHLSKLAWGRAMAWVARQSEGGEDGYVNFGAPRKEGAHRVVPPSVARQWLALARRLLAGLQSRLAWVPRRAVGLLPWVREAAVAGGLPSESSFLAE